jgi:hypothetical protein
MGRSALLFAGLDDNDVPKDALVHFGHEAYEHYMVAPYARELMMVRNSDYVCWSPSFEYLHGAICALGNVQFEELGSTLFSTIDKIDKLNTLRNVSPAVSYVGIEVSQLLIDLATGLHPSANLKHFLRWQEAPTPPSIVSRSYQSTSYAFQTTAHLVEWIARAKTGIHGVWFSLDRERQIDMIGNPATLFDPIQFSELARQAGLSVRVIKSEIYSHGDDRFSTSWVICERQSFDNAPDAVCTLSELSSRPYGGPHAALIPIKSNRPFDFSDLRHGPQGAHQVPVDHRS